MRILTAALLLVPPEAIPDARVLMTVVDGRPVYERR